MFGLHRWLGLLTLPNPFGDFSIGSRDFGGGELLRRRECSWNFSNVLWEKDIPSVLQFRSGRNPSLIERFYPRLGAVIPAHPSHLFGQPCLRV